MRAFKFLFLGCVALVAAVSCNPARRLFVEHDYSYESNFKTYSSYAFLECERDTGNICTEIYNAIHRQMQARGYKLTTNKPTLLVNYGIFHDNLRYQGYMQPVIKSWVSTGDQNYKYEPVKYSLEKGTLIVSLIDAESDQIVWRGYASGIFRNPKNVDNYYRNVVRSIFDQYELFATEPDASTTQRTGK